MTHTFKVPPGHCGPAGGLHVASWRAFGAGLLIVAIAVVAWSGGGPPACAAPHPSLPLPSVVNSYDVAYTLFPLNGTLLPGNVPSAGTLRPVDVAVDPVKGTVYVANHDSANVTVINASTNRPEAWVSVGHYPAAIVFDPANNEVYTPNDSSSNVTAIDATTNRVAATIPVGLTPSGIAFDPANGYLYVANAGSSNVSVIDGATDRVVTSISVGLGPTSIAVDPVNNHVFVPSSYYGNVTVIDGATNQVLTVLPPIGSSPGDAAYDAENGNVYIGRSAVDGIAVINGTTNAVVAVIPVYVPVWSVMWDPSTGDVLATTGGNPDAAVVVSTALNQRVSLVALGQQPQGLAYNPVNGYVYVANRLSGSLSLLRPGASSFPLTFTATGLPADAFWTVKLDGGQMAVGGYANNPLVLYTYNGTHNFTADAGPAYVTVSGSVVVSGASVAKTIAFAPSPTLWFGLPPWEVVAAAVLLVAIAAVVVAALFLRRRRQKPPTPPEPPST